MDFCKDFEVNGKLFKQQVIDLLYKELFKMSSNGCLEEWYELMTTHLNDSNNVWQTIVPINGKINVDKKKKDVLFECDQTVFSSSSISKLFSYPNLGHDVPVWLEDNENKNEKIIKIMIDSQDPLRGRGIRGNILFSSPFGVHCRDYRTQPNECMMKFIEGVWKIAKEHNLNVKFYLTDLYKLFVSDTKSSIKTLKVEQEGIESTFKTLLDEEIRIFQPDLILCFGNKTIESLLGKKVPFWEKGHKYNGIPVLPSIHISSVACGRWKKELNKIATSDDKAKHIITKIEESLNLM